MTPSSAMNEWIDTYLWNDHTELVDHLFPEAEADYPKAQRWLELKDSSAEHTQALERRGAAILRWGTYAWLGLPAEVEETGEHLQRLGMH